MRKAVLVEQRVALTLLFVATNTNYRTIGHLFGVSSVCVITKEVCAAIVKVLLPKYIQLPSGEELMKVVEGFQVELGFPQCAGLSHQLSVLPIISIEKVGNGQQCWSFYRGVHWLARKSTATSLGFFFGTTLDLVSAQSASAHANKGSKFTYERTSHGKNHREQTCFQGEAP